MTINLTEKQLKFVILCVKRRLNELSVLQYHSDFQSFDNEYDFASDLLGDLDVALENHLSKAGKEF